MTLLVLAVCISTRWSSYSHLSSLLNSKKVDQWMTSIQMWSWMIMRCRIIITLFITFGCSYMNHHQGILRGGVLLNCWTLPKLPITQLVFTIFTSISPIVYIWEFLGLQCQLSLTYLKSHLLSRSSILFSLFIWLWYRWSQEWQTRS